MMTNQYKSVPAGSIPTTWELRTYDVWGNAKDRYEVNDSYSAGKVELRIPQIRHNAGTSAEFIGAYPTDRQIKRVFGVNCRIETSGDDMTVYVERQRDGYPIGAMHCVSHESLSPVRKAKGGGVTNPCAQTSLPTIGVEAELAVEALREGKYWN